MSDNKLYCCLVVCYFLLAAAVSDSQHDEERQELLAKKVQKLTEWTSKDSIIRLTGDKFRKYIRESPRNYSVVVMLTALKPERQCGLCSEAKKQFQIVADSWRYSHQRSTDLFFAMADFDDAPDIFQTLNLNMVPVFMRFPAKGKGKKADTMQREWGAENLVFWIQERTGVQIKIYRPINYSFWATVVASLAVAGVGLYFLYTKLNFLLSHTALAIPILIVIFAQISGYMWNHIRQPPNWIKNPRTGEMIYVHPNQQSQLVCETYIIMMIYSSMLAGFIMLNEIDSLKKRWCKIILALAGLACFLIFFFTLLHFFKIKSPYYPYGFFDLLNDYGGI